jgi:hypothetical protein
MYRVKILILIILILSISFVESNDFNDKINTFMSALKLITPTSLIEKYENKNIDYHNFINNLSTRKDLNRVMLTLLRIIVLKKMLKFLVIIIFLFFLPVLSNDANGTIIKKMDDGYQDFDITGFFSALNFYFTDFK